MKENLKNLILIALIGSSVHFSSCIVDFVPDPINPDLTVYSAEGKNTASALINGEAWNSFASCGADIWCHRITAINEIDSKRLILLIHTGSMVRSNESFSLSFVIKDASVNSLSEIKRLDNLQLSLDGQPHYATMSLRNSTSSHEGKLFIREVKKIDSDNYIIAGTFGFIIVDDSGKTYEVFKGRFDSYIRYEEL